MENDNLSADRHLEQNIDSQKSILSSTFDKNFDIQEKTLSVIVDGLQYSNNNNHKTVGVIYNISGFVNLISYDLKIIGRDLTFSKKDWQKRLYARQAYLTIYESMDDLLQLCGTNLRNAIKDFHDFDDLNSKINAVTGKLNTYKRQHESTLKEIRNLVIAHRDHDILKQLNYISSINWIESINLISEYDRIVSELGSVCQILINRSVDEVHRGFGKA
jgi:hypothetical protein